jgi:hypothetical protein
MRLGRSRIRLLTPVQRRLAEWDSVANQRSIWFNHDAEVGVKSPSRHKPSFFGFILGALRNFFGFIPASSALFSKNTGRPGITRRSRDATCGKQHTAARRGLQWRRNVVDW